MTKSPKPTNQPDPKQLETLEAENGELKAGWQRSQADFENFRRRVADERMNLHQSVAAETLLELVPAFDNFQRAFAHVSDEHASWAEGFRHIARQMEDVFVAHGLTRIPTIGTSFDPTRHEAVSELPDTTHPPDTVSQELESGWMQGGKVLKPAKVVVSTGPEQK
jgi:molecular chaperone GrpE